MKKSPLVSIITSTFNADKFLTECIESIKNQTYKNLEFIVIDGGSTDETVDIIKKNETNIAYWVSEKDSGIYQAWNKGIKQATGDWVLFLGADDQLLPDALESYINFINANPDIKYDYVSSKVKRVRLDGSIEGVVGLPWRWDQFKYKMTTAHPGSFHSKQLFAKFGHYNEDYKIVSDYEMLLRPGKTLNAGFMDQITVIMSTGTPLLKINATLEVLSMFRKMDHLNKSDYHVHYIKVLVKFYIREQINKFIKLLR
jgi:glycosyltransferase involved in cell wall biosynthesis